MRIVVLAFLALTAFASIAADEPAAPPQKAVLVTGASTGIGRKITERLAAKALERASCSM